MATTSRQKQPASAYCHPASPSGTGAFRYRTGSPYFGTRAGSGIDIFVCSSTGLTDCRTVRHSGIESTLDVQGESPSTFKIQEGGKGYTVEVHKQLPLVLALLRVNLACRKNLVRHRHFSSQSTASVRHRHSGLRVNQAPLVTD